MVSEVAKQSLGKAKNIQITTSDADMAARQMTDVILELKKYKKFIQKQEIISFRNYRKSYQPAIPS